MICQRCNEQAAQVQYTEVVGGAKKVEWLCARCAKERGITVYAAGVTPTAAPGLPIPPLQGSERALSCPGCGLNLETFRESGRVGCPRCYEIFREVIDPLLRRVHHATQHAPREGGQDAESRLRRVLGTLRRELTEAVRREEFERAASLRDEIRRYEEESRDMSPATGTSSPSESTGDAEREEQEGMP